MNRTNRGQWQRGFVALAFVACALLLTACSKPRNQEALDQHRNLGKAYYENPATQQQAVQEFQQALAIAPDSARDKLNYALALLKVRGREEEAIKLLQEVQRQDPSLPHTWFNLGIYYKHQGDAERAIAQFQGMLARTPNEAITHYQLGTLYNQLNRRQEAQAQFEKAAELDPQLAAAPFQLYNLYRLAGNSAQADRYLVDFERIKELQKNWVIPENAEWCDYAEIYDPAEARAQTAAPQEPKFADTRLDGTVDAATAGLTLIDSTGSGQTDLLVWSSQGVRLFLQGQRPAAATGLEGLSSVIDVAPGDFNDDGRMDLCVLTETGPVLYRNTGGKFVREPAKLRPGRFDRAVWIDYDHDYDLDLVLLGPQPALWRNQGAAGWADRTGDFPFIKGAVSSARKLRVNPDSKAFDLAVFYRDHAPVLYRDQLGGRYAVEAFQGHPDADRKQVDADFEGIGRLDRARIDADGSIHLLRNLSAGNHRWIRVQLKGVRSLKLAQDALVEMKAGTLYRRQFYAGVPLLFDAGEHASVDVIRITWPNGLIQNEVRQATNQTRVYPEAQRLSGSCPMIWTWNGHKFQFITDVLGVAPLGARNGDGSYFPVDHVEWVQIPGSALQPVDGRYEVRITEELSEVSYLDQIQLYAVDHPAGTEIFTNEKFKGPPYPEFRLFGVERRIYPKTARDDNGADVLPQLIAKDQRYPDHFRRSETGVANLHSLELDFGSAAPSGKAILVLNGWVDWPDGSTFRRASQESEAGLVMPYLQVRDVAGAWKTVNPDMGMPAGKPKTIVVPVQFLSGSRRVRIVTNLCVYWDEVFLSEGASDAGVKPVPIALDSANLHFRGFSQTRIDPQRKQPDTFFYDRVSPVSFWNPTAGLYTRYGPVDRLLSDVDDQLVIMGSGDEVTLHFRADGLPAPGAGPSQEMTRDFLLKVDGWAKDRDPNTAFSSTVQPLPFHGMSRYPYPADEHFPRDFVHDSYQRTYNTRPARVVLPALDSR
ncbi:MAG TPA: FG-GAP-like repeat-containing protein [Bryobacteraceae bacterium]|nr:FG-GAP-like repeat-containing protein [Bryobacteraceae bacterium]